MPEQKARQAATTESELTRKIVDFRENPNPQTLNETINALLRASLLTPGDLPSVTFAPTPDAQGKVKLPKNTKINVPTISSPAGEKYYVAFSSPRALGEGRKHLPGRVCLHTRFDDYAVLLRENEQAAGLIIDPFTAAPFRLARGMIADIMAQRDAAQAVQLGLPRPGESITLAEPAAPPDALLEALCAVLAQHPAIEAAFLQLMLRENGPSCYLVILKGTAEKTMLTALAAAAIPRLPNQLRLALTPAESPLGRQGMEDTMPFYRLGEGRVCGVAVEKDSDV